MMMLKNHCSACGKSRGEVARLIEIAGGALCSDDIRLLFSMIEPPINGWQPISTAPAEVSMSRPVDIWMTVHASPMSFGMADAFRVPDCWRDHATSKWVHDHRGQIKELNERYITHWMPSPEAPLSRAEGSE